VKPAHISNCQSFLDKIHAVWLKGIIFLSAAAWQGNDMQAEQHRDCGSADFRPAPLAQCRANRSLNRKDPNFDLLY